MKWAAAAGGGSGFTKITTLSPSAVASINADSVFSSTYTSYQIVGFIETTADANFEARLRNAGSTLTTSTYFQDSVSAQGAAGSAWYIKDNIVKNFFKDYNSVLPTITEYNKIKNMPYLELKKNMTTSSPSSFVKKLIKDNVLLGMTKQKIYADILYDDSELADKCSESIDILTNEELDDDNYPLSKLQLMVRMKVYTPDRQRYRTKATFIKRSEDPENEKMDKLYKIRPYRLITQKDMDEIWPEWNSEDF